MPEIIISDTSCLIVLSKINELEILKKLYSEVIVTEEVVNEFVIPLPDWFLIKSPKDKTKQQILEIQIDKGEASSIALALEYKECTLILDDSKARKVAETLGLKITGTIGILIKAKQQKFFPLLKPILDKIKNSGFHLSKNLETSALKEAGE
jgi:predicted nucleic acid-binding protein